MWALQQSERDAGAEASPMPAGEASTPAPA